MVTYRMTAYELGIGEPGPELPTAEDVEHVLENQKHSVSSSSGWCLINNKEYQRLLIMEEARSA